MTRLQRKQMTDADYNDYMVRLFSERKEVSAENTILGLFGILVIVVVAAILLMAAGCDIALASENLIASWYSVESLTREGQWKLTKGMCADGKTLFSDTGLTCACNTYKFGSLLRISNISTGDSVVVRVTDRMAKRFTGKRIDLSRQGFIAIAGGERGLKKGLIPVTVESI